jgi:hypothetical protein
MRLAGGAVSYKGEPGLARVSEHGDGPLTRLGASGLGHLHVPHKQGDANAAGVVDGSDFAARQLGSTAAAVGSSAVVPERARFKSLILAEFFGGGMCALYNRARVMAAVDC